MDENESTNRQAWKKLVSVRATETARLWKTPCFVHHAQITAALGGSGSATIFDGDTEDGEPILDLITPTASMGQATFKKPVYFKHGVFVEIGANVTSVFLQIDPEK